MPLRSGAVLVASILAVGVTVLAQAPAERLAFDVVSIKPVQPSTPPGYRLAPGRFTAGRTVKELIQMAFGATGHMLAPDQIVGGPDWVATTRFAIDAKVVSLDAAWNTTVPTAFGRVLAPYLQSLLEDRFKLVMHMGTRDLPVYALVIARGDGRLGPHLRPSSLTPEDCRSRQQHPDPTLQPPACGIRNLGEKFTAVAQPLPLIIAFVNRGRLDRDVIDRTGLSGLFDAEFQRDDSIAVFTDVQEQLGLKLEPSRESRDLLVIDHVEKPAED